MRGGALTLAEALVLFPEAVCLQFHGWIILLLCSITELLFTHVPLKGRGLFFWVYLALLLSRR